uniref:Uncharacterized protein n=1 Tax=Paraburkholderia sprentiae WSM5005 TaxID=754502 RepID=A0A1I9YHB3_9BURK
MDLQWKESRRAFLLLSEFLLHPRRMVGASQPFQLDCTCDRFAGLAACLWQNKSAAEAFWNDVLVT